MKNIFFTILLLSSLTIMSQTPFIEPSWDLIPNNNTDKEGLMPFSIIETNDECYIVSLIHRPNDSDAKDSAIESSNLAKIVKFDNNGNMLHEIELQFNNSYYVQDVKLYVWNDTINVFSQLVTVKGDHFVLMHSYLFDDLSMSEQNEIWRKEFDDGLGWRSIMSTHPLIDENGCRTFHFEYYTPMSFDYTAIFLKLDTNFNVISEYEYDVFNDLNNAISMPNPLMYNVDSTQYYYVSFSANSPYYYFMNVLDMDFNLVEQIPLESNPAADLLGFGGYWCQNPYDGKTYAFGLVAHPNIKSEIGAFKIDVDSESVVFKRLSHTSNEIKNSILLDENLCFLPDGKIIGCAIYDVTDFLGYKQDAYYAYIPLFDTNMKKISEWYYTLGYEYNMFLYDIHATQDNGVIFLGYIRYMQDNEIFNEPYIVKFPASAFDPDNIEEAHAHGLHLAVAYPNPGGDVMNIRTGLRNAVLTVYDLQGRKIHEQEITDDVTSIDASNWQSGTYIWKLGMRNEELGMKEVESGKWVK